MKVLLSIAGGSVVIPFDSLDVSELFVERGRSFDAKKRLLEKGEPNDCHGNAARLWRKNEDVTIVTGYALSRDGMWRRHSWIVEKTNRLVETTVTRTKYFGVALDKGMARSFSNAFA